MSCGVGDFTAEPSLWRKLSVMDKPLVLYGMGDGADKLIARLEKLGRKPDGVFASDEFVRGQSFRGFKVLTYAEAERLFGEMCVLVCFGTEQPDVLSRIYDIAERQELYAPHLPLFGDSLFDEAFVERYGADLLAVDNLWADEQSRAVYRSYLAYMWSGRVELLRSVESPRRAAWQELNLSDDEVFWDFGAYDGDTVAEFCDLVGSYRQIAALEPDVKNFQKLAAAMEGLPNVRVYPYAVWNESGEIDFAGKAGRNSAVAGAGAKKVQTVRAVSPDDLAADTLPPTFIKFDVEGAEEQALLGAKRVLSGRPKLALSAYHRTEDIVRLPLLLKRTVPEYELRLRHHPYVPGWETNIYAC